MRSFGSPSGKKQLISRDKKLYYECLQIYDEKEDIEPLKQFLEYSQEKTWKKKENPNKKGLKDYTYN